MPEREPEQEHVLHQVVQGWAGRRPAALAVSNGAEQLTYEQLDERVNRLVGKLLAAGLAPAEPVILLAERGVDLVVAQLGTLVAGGAFVCVPPEHPWSRLNHVMSIVGPGAVIADAGARERHGEQIRTTFPGVAQLPAHPGSPAGDDGGEVAPRPNVAPDDLAYIAFTSGSTGRPKGIPHRHATLSQFVAWQGEAFGIDEGSRVAQLAPPGFDVSYCEIFGALCRGASLHIPPEETRSDPGLLVTWLRHERITLLQIVPAHWQAVLAELPTGNGNEPPLPDLATVMFVGEALAPSLVAETRERLRPAPRLVNVYGPTEVVAATFHEVGDVPAGFRSVPIGIPIPEREVVLDPVGGDDTVHDPADDVGEICIRSRYLTTGYLGADPEDTAEEGGSNQRFVRDPVGTRGSGSPDPARSGTDRTGVLYRTGDLARRLPGGELLFVGRADNQVKLRGQRVELEDVEAAIVGTGEVAEAAATVVTPQDGLQSLVALVVPHGPGELDLGSLRERLAGALPGYMVPNAVVDVDGLPRNANGKIDRVAVRQRAPEAALPEDDAGDPAAGKGAGVAAGGPGPTADGEAVDGEAPAGELEEAIAGIWQELLGVTGIGRHDHLFSLGGDSLLAMRLISRVRSRLGLRATLGAFFEEPTIAGLATAAASTSSTGQGTPLRRQPVA